MAHKHIALVGTLDSLAEINRRIAEIDWDFCGHAQCVTDALDEHPEGCYFDLHPSYDYGYEIAAWESSLNSDQAIAYYEDNRSEW